MGAEVYSEWWRPSTGSARQADAGRIEDGESAVPFWGLMGFTFILLIAPQQMFPVLAPLRIALLAAAFAVASFLFDRFTRREPIMTFSREMWIVICLAGWAVATVPLSYWPGGSVAFLMDIYFKTLIVFWLLCNVVNTLRRLELIAWGLSLMALPLAVTGIENFLTGAYLEQGAGPGASRIVGYVAPLTSNPNDLALMLNLILPLCIALFLGSKKTSARATLVFCIALIVGGIIATFSRAGFLVLAVTFASYLWTLRKRPERKFAVAALVVALAAVPFLPSSYLDRLSTITDIESDPTGSAQSRWSDTVDAAKYTLEHPIIGAGVGQNILAMNEIRGEAWKDIHNVYLQYSVELGLPGLALFLFLLVSCLKCVRDVQRQCAGAPDEQRLFYLAEGIRVSLVAFAVAGPFYPVGYHFYFYYIAGLAVASKTVSARTLHAHAEGEPGTRGAGGRDA